MKKICFSDKYGLTQAVLEGKKVQTRRWVRLPKTFNGIPVRDFCKLTRLKDGAWNTYLCDEDEREIDGSSLPFPYERGERVAIAQRYSAIWDLSAEDVDCEQHQLKDGSIVHFNAVGVDNKMFVRADLMPNQIDIIDLDLQHIQSITEEECLMEGIVKGRCGSEDTHFMDAYYIPNDDQPYVTAKDAYSALIDALYGKNTWDNNPWVWVITFKLVKG